MCKNTSTDNSVVKETMQMHNGITFWSNIYQNAPKLYIPSTQFDIGFTIVSFCIISLLRLINEFIWINILEFNPNSYKTIESASALTSLAHALVLCSGLYAALVSQPYVPSAPIASAPKDYQFAVTALLQMCTGYMFYDAIFMIKSNGWSIHPDDVSFLGHHVVTILYMSQTRVLGVGHISAMSLMFTGELTNPLQNGHLITKFGIQLAAKGSLFHVLHPYLEFVYSLIYLIMRGLVGFVQIAHISYHMLCTKEGRNNVSLKVSVLWVLMIWGILIGSIPWTKECLEMIKDGLDVKYDESWNYGPRYEL